MWLPEIDGALSAKEASQTAKSIADLQLSNGMIPWFVDGHADPWNHIECAMALDLAGLHDHAEKAYEWLKNTQLENGAWYQYYVSSFVKIDRMDANCAAYVAAGVWHHYLCTQDESFLEEMWEVVKPAMEFVLDLQTSRGEILWARHGNGEAFSFSLLTGSCSIYHSLNTAVKIAEKVDDLQIDWGLAAETLGKVIDSQPEAFTPKKQWAMDWYYPVLSGAITDKKGLEHLKSKEAVFIDEEKGVRCISNRPWFTAAETAECTMAYLRVGGTEMAEKLFASTSAFRLKNGSYYTGIVHPQAVTYPDKEISSYTSAAILIAADALTGASPASEMFVADLATVDY